MDTPGGNCRWSRLWARSLSERPNVVSRRHSGGSGRVKRSRRRGRICCSTITLNSEGTPGVKNIRQRFSCRANPHAVPTGLSTSSALAGISACLRLLGAITRPRSEKKRSICESHASCSTSPSPFAVAAASALRSSLVGPSPPFTISTSQCSLRSRRMLTSDSRLSPTVLRRVNGNPCSKKRSASQAALVSIICPCSTSSPVDNISTLIIVFSRLFGENTIAQSREGEERNWRDGTPRRQD